MFLVLNVYPGTPAWLASFSSFIIAVIAVSFLEVAYTEIQYKRFKQKIRKKGFGSEKYYEARFLLNHKKPEQVLKKIAKEYNLTVKGTLQYKDIYYENKLPEFTGRTPKLRIRYRTNTKGGMFQTAQIVYTRATELSTEKLEQHRYYPIRKEKYYHIFDGKKTIEGIQNKEVKKFLEKNSNKKTQEITFVRLVANSDDLFVGADYITKDSFMIELKVFEDKKTLMKAMRYVMTQFPVEQTTSGKSDLYE